VIVHVLTPVSRPELLPAVTASLSVALLSAPEIRLVWHLSYDLERRYVSGWKLRNEMLDDIERGWIWLLDDDTEAHPSLLARLWEYRDSNGIVFSQDGREPPGIADPERLANGDHRERLSADATVFDTGMVICRRGLIGDYRFREHRAADGYFWEDVLSKADDVIYLDEFLATYNSLRPGEWG